MSSGQRFVLPYQTVVNGVGVPIAGALLNFYDSGTSTPAETYADANLTQPNPNPVAADAGGQFPNIFLDPSVTYKVVLTDSTGAQQWTADPVSAFGSGGAGSFSTYSDIAALRAAQPGTPSGLVYVEAYSTNAPVGGGWFAYVADDTTSADNGGTIIVDASHNRYYRLYFGACSIDNFGAVQDSGVTNNAAAINAALAACNDVLVPGSEKGAWYGFSSVLVIPKGTRLRGVGKASILKAAPSVGTGAPLLQNATPAPAASANRDDGIFIEDLTLDANSQGSSTISLVAATNFRLSNLWLLNAGGDNILISAKATDATIYPQNGLIEGVYAYNGVGAGVNITAGVEITLRDLQVDTCAQSAGAVSAGVLLKAAGASALGRNIKITNPVVRNCGDAAVADAGILVNSNGSATWSEISVIGGSIDAQTGAGVSVAGGTAFLASGLTVTAASSDGFYLTNATDPVLNGCVASGCTRDGVRLDGTTANARITGGAFIGNTGYGVNEVNGAVNGSFVWGCARTGNTAGAQILTGASSQCDASFVYSGITPTADTNGTQAHSLGMVPKSFGLFLKCVTAELGHSIGDIVKVNGDSSYGGGNGLSVGADAWVSATNISWAFEQQGASIVGQSAGHWVQIGITPANWTAFVVCKGYY